MYNSKHFFYGQTSRAIEQIHGYKVYVKSILKMPLKDTNKHFWFPRCTYEQLYPKISINCTEDQCICTSTHQGIYVTLKMYKIWVQNSPSKIIYIKKGYKFDVYASVGIENIITS